MKKILLLLTIGGVACLSFGEKIKRKIFINQCVEHPALNTTIKGIIDELVKNGYKPGTELDLRVESAQASPALASQISVKFVNQNPDIVVGVGTISAQSFVKHIKKNNIKFVFSSITDPLKAELVQSLNKPGNNTSGVSNFVELSPQVEVFKEIQPHLTRLGVLYNPGEVNSLSLIKKLKELCPKFGITVVLQAVDNTSQVAQAATKLAANVDAIFISNDNTALSSLQTIISIATKVKVPVYVSDTDAVKLGALAALGPNQYKLGVQTAKMIVCALKGKDLGTIPVEFPEQTELYLNQDAAEKLGIFFKDSIKRRAKEIVGKKTS
ncbi:MULTISPECIES: ABC transporter substrate-binding protein [Holospora]|uniref:ABC-type uncharacterized transport system, periplasmic component n=2 Tax=Holospora TaxID=44747 RepID=A0A061JIK5_9PROT|nr:MULTISPECIES: ABC transporter substrate-binding protein [Holospora]ETZ04909.1 ABC-type uncharacterized transport system, periplasmic component [Holospora undulata HU1]GAJ46443.1 ABC-type uncharacterized transport system, periplasmic component [Holospora elegans E1]